MSSGALALAGAPPRFPAGTKPTGAALHAPLGRAGPLRRDLSLEIEIVALELDQSAGR